MADAIDRSHGCHRFAEPRARAVRPVSPDLYPLIGDSAGVRHRPRHGGPVVGARATTLLLPCFRPRDPGDISHKCSGKAPLSVLASTVLPQRCRKLSREPRAYSVR